jgi:isopenicillin N synthase-like dioxygenase
MFAESRRFHALPEAEKSKLPWRDEPLQKIGYEPFARKRAYAYNTALVTPQKPNLYSQFVYVREAEDDPRSKLNAWPANLPGFKDTLLAYNTAIEQLGRKFLPLWSRSLGLPLDYFDRFFKVPHVQTGMLHYPPQKDVGNRQYGLVPHTDNAMMTFLAQANVPGLAVRMPSGRWRLVDIVPGTLVVNTGNVIVVWTNEEYLSTKHRVINTTSVDRYSIPVFFGPSEDALVEVVPTCRGPQRPALYEPITYGDLRSWYFGGRKKMN